MSFESKLRLCIFTSLFLFITLPKADAFNLATSDEAKWSAEEVSVDFNASSCPSSISLQFDTERAFDISWNSIASSNLRLVIGNSTTDTTATNGRILVRCASLGATGGGGTTSFSTQNANIISGNVRINADLDWNALGGGEAVAFVIGHELGHAIGFSHSDSEEAMMFFSGIREGIAQDDIDGATYLYPRNDITDGPFGCGTIDTNNSGPPEDGLAQFSFLLVFLALCSFVARRRFAYATRS